VADPRKPPGPEWDPAFDDAEIFVEQPTAPSLFSPLPEDDGAEVIAIDDAEDNTDQQSIGDVPMIAEPLPEMTAEMWQAGIQAVVTVTDDAEPVWPSPDEWAAEARLYRAESTLVDDPAAAAALLLAAARASELASDGALAERLCDEALTHLPTGPDLLRARARLAESRGDYDEAHALWARLATAAVSAEERAFYGALSAEWTLARSGRLPAVAREAIPVGPARTLARAEEALRTGASGSADVAAALADVGREVGGPLGASLLEQAARFREAIRDRRGAAADRAAAAAIDTPPPGDLLGRLRDAARADDRSARGILDAVAENRSGPLAAALARWRASVALRAGDKKAAGELRADLEPVSAAAARDRIDHEVADGLPLDAASLDKLRAGITVEAGTAILTWIEAGNLARRGEAAAALALVGRAIAENPDAIPLALLAEELATAATDPGLGAAALDLWLRGDPARRAEAALALARAREAAGDAMAARGALQTAIEAAPGSALFWSVAASDARAGRHADAAATLAYGAEMWAPSALAPSLSACATAHMGLADPARALADLLAATPGSAAAASSFADEARIRLAERAQDAAALTAALTATAASTNLERRASLAARRAQAAGEADAAAGRAILDEALDMVPDHPSVLPLYLLGAETTPGAAAEAMWRAGTSDGSPSRLGRLYQSAAAAAAALDPDDAVAVRRAGALVAALPGDRLAQLALVRAAERLGPEQRARAIAELAGPADGALGLLVAEALADTGDSERARAAFAGAGGRFAAEAARARARLPGGNGDAIPARLLQAAGDDGAATARAALTDIFDAARSGEWDDAVASLRDNPPHETAAGAATLQAAALLAEGRGRPADAAALEAAALAVSTEAVPVSVLGRVAERDGNVALRLRALEVAGQQLAAAGDRASAGVAETHVARLLEAAGRAEPAAERWRAALATDPTNLAAALAIRRHAARSGDIAAAVDATESEAACLLVPERRVHALLLAAALAEEAARDEEGGVPHRRRALALLRSVLEIEPDHDAAFEQLRSLLDDADDAQGLADALAARLAVASNPFEVTSLRLARADLLSSSLADRAGARAELDAILQKQPEHPRALARLAELLWNDAAWEEAGEAYLRRSMVEREPAILREIFLRLGHIYRERVPDPRRALTAYERVRTIEPDNREALRALSDLYLGEGDAKQALPVTERLAASDPDPQQRIAHRVRLGDLLMRTGDLRRAASELRRVVDMAPRNLAAVTTLAQLLERARDHAGRRALLDHAVGLMRHDVQRGELDVGTLRSLVALLVLRERPRAAAAAAGLVTVLDGGAAPVVAGRSLQGLRRPELDERSFPPGLPPGVRQVLRLLGPALRPTGAELAQHISLLGVTRTDRPGRGDPPRPVFEAVAAELGAGEFELYLKKSAGVGSPLTLHAEPGAPPAIIVGTSLADLGPAAIRFAAARALRLTATNLDAILADTPEQAAAYLVGIIRQFVPEFRHAEVREALVDGESARAARLIPRKARATVAPFAIESAGPFDVAGLHTAVRDGANAAGLLACADLPAALTVVLAIAGVRDRTLTLSPIVANPEALALLRFAVSDDYDELAAALEA
jgi:hypothetical protein